MTHTAGLTSHRLEIARGLIARTLGSKLLVKDLASAVCMSEFHFSRWFAKSTGQSPHAYITRARMEEAKRLLRDTWEPLGAIAAHVGYRTHAHFSGAFRLHVGQPPRAYRASVRSGGRELARAWTGPKRSSTGIGAPPARQRMAAMDPDVRERSRKAKMLRLLIVDDHDVVRIGLRELFSRRVDMEVVAEARTGEEAIAAVRSVPIDVALVDLALSDLSGIDVLHRIKAIHREIAVLIVSGYAENQYAISLLKAGASGFVAKDALSGNLVTAVLTAAQGRRYVSAEIAEKLARNLTERNLDAPPHSRLSEREFQIFCKLATGQSVTQISKDLVLSVKTVSTYRTRILEKMEFKSNANITQYAVKTQLIA